MAPETLVKEYKSVDDFVDGIEKHAPSQVFSHHDVALVAPEREHSFQSHFVDAEDNLHSFKVTHPEPLGQSNPYDPSIIRTSFSGDYVDGVIKPVRNSDEVNFIYIPKRIISLPTIDAAEGFDVYLKDHPEFQAIEASCMWVASLHRQRQKNSLEQWASDVEKGDYKISVAYLDHESIFVASGKADHRTVRVAPSLNERVQDQLASKETTKLTLELADKLSLT